MPKHTDFPYLPREGRRRIQEVNPPRGSFGLFRCALSIRAPSQGETPNSNSIYPVCMFWNLARGIPVIEGGYVIEKDQASERGMDFLERGDNPPKAETSEDLRLRRRRRTDLSSDVSHRRRKEGETLLPPVELFNGVVVRCTKGISATPALFGA